MRLLKAAQDELERAIEWYNEQAPGLGDELLEEIIRYGTLLTERPRMGLRIHTRHVGLEIRRFPIARRFPYVLVYLVEDEPLIVAVAHAKREQGYWLKRLDGLG